MENKTLYISPVLILFIVFGLMYASYQIGHNDGERDELFRQSSVSDETEDKEAVSATIATASPDTCFANEYELSACEETEGAANWEKEAANYDIYRIIEPGKTRTLVEVTNFNCLGQRKSQFKYAKLNQLMEDFVIVKCPEVQQ